MSDRVVNGNGDVIRQNSFGAVSAINPRSARYGCVLSRCSRLNVSGEFGRLRIRHQVALVRCCGLGLGNECLQSVVKVLSLSKRGIQYNIKVILCGAATGVTSAMPPVDHLSPPFQAAERIERKQRASGPVRCAALRSAVGLKRRSLVQCTAAICKSINVGTDAHMTRFSLTYCSWQDRQKVAWQEPGHFPSDEATTCAGGESRRYIGGRR